MTQQNKSKVWFALIKASSSTLLINIVANAYSLCTKNDWFSNENFEVNVNCSIF
jgi:hypothetical protein